MEIPVITPEQTRRAVALIVSLRKEVLLMDPAARVITMEIIGDGYCRDCGRDDPDGSCQCQNDE